jgi:hypothetical protein
LTHNADPATNLAAAALYAYEAQDIGGINTLRLESTTDSDTSVWGETANGLAGVAASCRFWVTDNDSPHGVALYVNESESDRLEFVSPTETDGYIVMPFEGAVEGLTGAACLVKVTHSASAGDGKDLFFDDNGAAGAQLCFVDTGGAGGTIPAGDISLVLPSYVQLAAGGLADTETSIASAATAEVANDVNIGNINFIAIGLMY